MQAMFSLSEQLAAALPALIHSPRASSCVKKWAARCDHLDEITRQAAGRQTLFWRRCQGAATASSPPQRAAAGHVAAKAPCAPFTSRRSALHLRCTLNAAGGRWRAPGSWRPGCAPHCWSAGLYRCTATRVGIVESDGAIHGLNMAAARAAAPLLPVAPPPPPCCWPATARRPLDCRHADATTLR